MSVTHYPLIIIIVVMSRLHVCLCDWHLTVIDAWLNVCCTVHSTNTGNHHYLWKKVVQTRINYWTRFSHKRFSVRSLIGHRLKMTIDRTGRPPAPRRASSTYRSYDELGVIDRAKPLKYRHGGIEDLTGIEQVRAYRTYEQQDLDNITVISSEEVPKPKKKITDGLANGFRRTFSVRSRREEPEGIPLDTFNVTYEENFATVRGAPFGRRRSLSRDRGSSILGRSSSEGDVRMVPPRAPPAAPAPRLHRCLRALGGSWKNLLLCEFSWLWPNSFPH